MAGINAARNALYDKLKKQGLSDEEALMQADKGTQTTTPKKKGEGAYSKAKNIIGRVITKWTRRNPPKALTEKRKYTEPTMGW